MYAVLTSVSFLAQETKNARIIQELNYSNIFYYIIQVDNTNTFYKTTASDIRKFKVNDIVKLKDVNRPDNYLEVLYTNLEGITLAERLISNQNTRLSNDVLFSLPTIHDGILFFDNEIHYSEFYKLLEAEEERFLSLNRPENEFLELLENEFTNYSSFNRYHESLYNDSTGMTLKELRLYDNADHFNEEIIKTLVNENKMIGLGNSVHYIHSIDEAITFDFNYKEGLTKLLKISKKHKKDVNLSTPNLAHDNELKYDSEYYNFLKDLQLVLSDAGQYAYQSIGTLKPIGTDCNNYSVNLQVETFQGVFTPGVINQLSPFDAASANGATILIEWGDGSTETAFPSLITTDIRSYYDYNHTYTSPGNYTVTLSINFVDPITDAIPVLLEDIVTNVEYTQLCTTANREEPIWEGISNNWMLKTKIWVNHSWWSKRIGSYSHAFKLKNGKWKRRKAHLTTSISGAFRNDLCENAETKSGNKSRNSRRCKKTKSKIFARYGKYTAGNGEITSSHTLNKDGIVISNTMEIIACP